MKKKWSLIILVLTTVIGVAFRFSEVSQNTKELSLGFIITVITGMVLLAITVLFGKTDAKEGMVSAYDADISITSRNIPKSIAIISLFTAIFIVTDLLYGFGDLVATNKVKPMVLILKYVFFTLKPLTALVFLITVIMSFAKKPFSKGLGYAYLLPAVWSTLRSAQLFKNSSVIISDKENLLKLLYLLSQIVFFVFFARYRAGFEKKHTRQNILIFGSLVVSLTFASVMPAVFDGGAKNVYFNSLTLCDLYIAFFALCVIIEFFGSYETVKEIPESETEISTNVNTIESQTDSIEENL